MKYLERTERILWVWLYLFSKLSLLSSVRPLSFPLSKHLWTHTCGRRRCWSQTWAKTEAEAQVCQNQTGVWFASHTSLLQSKKSTNFTSAFPSISLFQPSRLSALRGKPSIRKRNFWSSFVMVSSMAWQNTHKINHLTHCVWASVGENTKQILKVKCNLWNILRRNQI